MTNQLSKTVLIVDDDRVFLDSLEQFLLQRGYHCKVAWDTDSALKIIRDFSLDVVVVDVVMPGKDGVQLMNETKADLPDLDFIIMTGYSYNYSYVEIINAGASDYITKPFEMMELVARIERIEREKRLLRELRSTNEQLQETVTQVNEMMEEVQQASRAKSNLLANISHEIRTPLTGILGFTDILLSSEINNEQLEYATNIKMSGEVILSLINDFLDSSKIEAGQMRLEVIEFDPEALCYDVCDLIRPRLYGKPVDLICRIDDRLPAQVCGDPHRFRQILLNLMSNAAKFTDSGEITLSLSLDESPELSSDQVGLAVSVADTGIGIPETESAQVFEPFCQSRLTMPGKYGGTGLGLFISKKIVALMGGEIQVSSQPGQGSCFSFGVVMHCADPQAAAKQFVYPELAGKRALIVDHNATNLEIVAHLLQRVGMSIATDQTGQEIAALIGRAQDEQAPFDLCLIDISLVKEDSEQFPFLDDLNHAPQVVCPPMIAVSEPFEGNTRKCEKAGFDGFLSRPVRREALFRIIRNVLLQGRRTTEASSRRPMVTTYTEQDNRFRQGTILLADDNAVNQKLMSAMLTKAGYEVEVVSDGQAVIDRYTTQPDAYGLILMDVQMPKIDGVEATQRIRQWEQANGRDEEHPPRQVAIIAVTAGQVQGQLEKYLAQGMDDFIPKPVRREFLFEVIAKWLQP